jgi:hypothetical protein
MEEVAEITLLSPSNGIGCAKYKLPLSCEVHQRLKKLL